MSIGSGRLHKVDYKWIALSNTTLGVTMAALNSSIVLISLPAIFRGLNVNPLEPAESGYLLWMLLGYMVITATLLVTLGRLSDMWGRVKLYNLGFVIFTIGSILLFLTPSSGNAGALEMIIFRLIQGVGGGFLIANSAAILTDAFPANERGTALGLNMVAVLAGSLLGLVVGGILSTLWWRSVFLVSVPIGIFGTIWAYKMLREQATRRASKGIDLLGNLCLGLGLTIFLVAMTYGIDALRRRINGLGQPAGAGGYAYRPLAAGSIRDSREQGGRPAFQYGAVQHPRLQHGLRGAVAQLTRLWRLPVRADRLAAGHLAAPARLCLRGYPGMGRHLHYSAADRLHDLRRWQGAGCPTGLGRAASALRA